MEHSKKKEKKEAHIWNDYWCLQFVILIYKCEVRFKLSDTNLDICEI